MIATRGFPPFFAVVACAVTCGGKTETPPLRDSPDASNLHDASAATVDGNTGTLDGSIADAPGDVALPDASVSLRPASCRPEAPGAAYDCGANHDDDCCASPVVPGGKFLRFYDGEVYKSTSFPATISTLRIDKYEITVGRFRQFVEAYPASKPKAGDGAHPKIPGSGWQASWPIAADQTALRQVLSDPSQCPPIYPPNTVTTWTDSPGPNEHKPMSCVTGYELFAFCAWDGGRLPTAAERNYTASGGSEQRVYPWSVPPGSTVVDQSYAVYTTDQKNPPPGPDDVGNRPKGAGKWGQLDLGSNVIERVLDGNASPGDCIDCAVIDGYTPGGILEGGGWGGEANNMMNASDGSPIESPGFRGAGLGGRCARSL